uniref:Uncharacterized protein n=1 Tax=Gibberella zeae TaxID=5518 RepID=A0A4E9EL27_GIBZA
MSSFEVWVSEQIPWNQVRSSLVFFATPVRFEGDGENKDNRVSPYITIEIPELSDYRVADDTS